MVSTPRDREKQNLSAPSDPAKKPRRPLDEAGRKRLLTAIPEWRAAGCFVHPARVNGSKQPVNIEGASRSIDPATGRHGWGYGRIRDGEMPPLSMQQMGAMVRRGGADGIGFFCGDPSGGVICLEVEGRAAGLLDTVRSAAEAAGCLHLLERLGAGCVEESAGGGIHFMLRVVGGPAGPSVKLAERPDPDLPGGALCLAEVRGTGGWIVTAPSAGRTHKSGRAYRLLRGGPATIPDFTVEEYGLLCDCFRSIDEMPKAAAPAAAPAPRKQRLSGHTLADDFAERVSWAEILEPAGWRKSGGETGVVEDGGTTAAQRQGWTRPGKSGGVSAVTTGAFLRVFSSSAWPLPTYVPPSRKGESGKNALTKFAAYAYLYHAREDGTPDYRAAARDLAAKGFCGDDLAALAVEEQAAPQGPLRDIESWRQEVVADRAMRATVPGIDLDRSPTGTGKTFAIIEMLRRPAVDDDGILTERRSLTGLPTHENCVERVREMQAVGLDAAAYPDLTEDTCHPDRFGLAMEVRALGLSVGQTVCIGCPFSRPPQAGEKDTQCHYKRRLREAMQAQHAVATHERLRMAGDIDDSRHIAAKADIIVIDEAVETVLAPSLAMPVADLDTVSDFVRLMAQEGLIVGGKVLEADPESKRVAEALLRAHAAIVEAAEGATEPGVVAVVMQEPIDIEPQVVEAEAVPDRGAVQMDLLPADGFIAEAAGRRLDGPLVDAALRCGRPAEAPARRPRLNWQQVVFRWARERLRGAGEQEREKFQAGLRLLSLAAAGRLEQIQIVTDRTEISRKGPDGEIVTTAALHPFVVGSWRMKFREGVKVYLLDATAVAADIEDAYGMPVEDTTPAGHLPLVHPITQVVGCDITKGDATSTAAGLVEGWMQANPGERVGLIGHRKHIEEMLESPPQGRRRKKRRFSCLEAGSRARVVKAAYFGQGPDRGSNLWHLPVEAGGAGCTHLLIVGTPRVNPGDIRRWLVRHGLLEAARLPDGGYGPRPWRATRGAEGVVVEGMGYSHPEWQRAHEALCRATIRQAVGRARAILPEGIPVTIISTEGGIEGATIDDRIEPVQSAVREAVEVVRRLSESAKNPIESPYRVSCAFPPLNTPEVVRAISAELGIGERAAQVRVRRAVEAGLLERPSPRQVVLAGRPPTPEPAIVQAPGLPATVVATGPPAGPPGIVSEIVRSGRLNRATVTVEIGPGGSTIRVRHDLMVEAIVERAAIREYDGGLDRNEADRLAVEEVQGPIVLPIEVMRQTVGCDIEGANLLSHPLVAKAREQFGSTFRVMRQGDDQTGLPPRPAEAGKKGLCRCGSSAVRQVPIHGGRSMRAECDACGQFIAWTVWYGQEQAGGRAGPSAEKQPPPRAPNSTSPDRHSFPLAVPDTTPPPIALCG